MSSQDCKSVDSLSRISQREQRESSFSLVMEELILSDLKKKILSTFYESVCLNLSDRIPKKERATLRGVSSIFNGFSAFSLSLDLVVRMESDSFCFFLDSFWAWSFVAP